ncbi:hypothetical protein [Paraburkholderia sp. BR14374]|uniref:hypothetical protein n=1 Tax=Paraburkholderia sp. BR14374 TaxID=3237007 RepID=UPI0034CDAF54
MTEAPGVVDMALTSAHKLVPLMVIVLDVCASAVAGNIESTGKNAISSNALTHLSNHCDMNLSDFFRDMFSVQ